MISQSSKGHFQMSCFVQTRFQSPCLHLLMLVKVRVVGAAAQVGKPRHFSPWPPPPTSLEGSQDVPRPAERCNPSSVS